MSNPNYSDSNLITENTDPVYSGSNLISEATILVSLSILFGIAFSTTCVRIYARWRVLKKFSWLDDGFFYLAASSVTAAWALGFYEAFYFTVPVSEITSEMLMKSAIDNVQLSMANHFLLWVTIYSVKLSFMFYFRPLLRLRPKLERWWNWVIGFLILATTIGVPIPFYTCPFGTKEALVHCTQSPSFVSREASLVYVSVVFDILTDLLLTSIPFKLTWAAAFPRSVAGRSASRTGTWDKVCMLFVAHCTLFMIAIALIRLISTAKYGVADESWVAFWVTLEALVAVIVVSFPTFRGLFIKWREDGRDRRFRARLEARCHPAAAAAPSRRPRRHHFWRLGRKPSVPALAPEPAIELQTLETIPPGRAPMGTQTDLTQFAPHLIGIHNPASVNLAFARIPRPMPVYDRVYLGHLHESEDVSAEDVSAVSLV
ncbi:hypothetical protein MMC13_004501 [Lambiella insularis]|nr:hypothetical protein [Lambiella insularis]